MFVWYLIAVISLNFILTHILSPLLNSITILRSLNGRHPTLCYAFTKKLSRRWTVKYLRFALSNWMMANSRLPLMCLFIHIPFPVMLQLQKLQRTQSSCFLLSSMWTLAWGRLLSIWITLLGSVKTTSLTVSTMKWMGSGAVARRCSPSYPHVRISLPRTPMNSLIRYLVMPALWLFPSSRFLLPSCLMSKSNSRMLGFDSWISRYSTTTTYQIWHFLHHLVVFFVLLHCATDTQAIVLLGQLCFHLSHVAFFKNFNSYVLLSSAMPKYCYSLPPP